MKLYHFQVRYRLPGGQIGVQSGTVNANSEQEVIAFIRRKYMNIVDYNVW